MKHWLFGMTLICFGSSAHASPYFRLINTQNIQQSAAVSFGPSSAPVAKTDVAIFTHSTADGSICSLFNAGSWCEPEQNAWTLGGGGNPKLVNGKIAGTAVVSAGWSVNLAPQLGALILSSINTSSPAWLQGVKSAMLNEGGNGVRIGGSLNGNLVNNGTVQSFREMFPGRGPLDIVKQAGRVDVGYGWKWK